MSFISFGKIITFTHDVHTFMGLLQMENYCLKLCSVHIDTVRFVEIINNLRNYLKRKVIFKENNYFKILQIYSNILFVGK